MWKIVGWYSHGKSGTNKSTSVTTMNKKNVAVKYNGGCGGHLLYYFLLANRKYSAYYKEGGIVKKIKENDCKKIKQQFYLQFNKNKEWLKYETWPDNTDYKDSSQLFFFCGKSRPDYIKICPYIKDYKTWFRTVLYKKTNIFRNENITLSLVKKKYKALLDEKDIFDTRRKNCDYYFEITKFVNNLTERKKLCDFLSIPHTILMEEFISHYNDLHKELKRRTSW